MAALPSGPAAAPDLDGERRHLTVMFCDLVESTVLSEELDPEELLHVLRAYHEACARVIGRFGGLIAQYLGDGLLVYFGYPRADEDDTRRAVRAALGIVEAVASLSPPPEAVGATFRVRIGIHAGVVVVGPMGSGARHELLALGRTPNLAARLQNLAEPNTVIVSAETYPLIRGFFVCRDLGTRTLKGVAAPVSIYQVMNETSARSRLEAMPAGSRTSLVGRERELGLLRDAWSEVSGGVSRAIVVTGEPGIGKSRLVEALRQELPERRHVWWECGCSPAHQASALHPVVELFQRVFRLDPSASNDEKVQRLEVSLAEDDIRQPEAVALWASLMGLPLGRHASAVTGSAARQRQRILEGVLDLLRRHALRQPVVLVVDDLQWADASTRELLDLLVHATGMGRVLTLVSSRPDPSAFWSHEEMVGRVTLGRLDREETKRMVGQLAGGRRLPRELIERIGESTDGVPLFVEELTRMILESGMVREGGDGYELTGPLHALGIPSTLQTLLMARLDRLGSAKGLAQVAATLGRSFPYALLQAVAEVDDATYEAQLAALREADLLHTDGLAPYDACRFRHGLLQEAAYQSLLRGKRQQYHARVAQLLEGEFRDLGEAQPEVVGHHYVQAGMPVYAIRCYQVAGERAVARSANVEATGHLRRVIELVGGLPGSPDRSQQELAAQTVLGVALMACKGYANAEVGVALRRARQLGAELGEDAHLAPVLRGLAGHYYVRADLRAARELSEEVLAIAERGRHLGLALGARLELSSALFSLGELAAAVEHSEQGIELYEGRCLTGTDDSDWFTYGQDLGVSLLYRAALGLTILGVADTALERIRRALELARRFSHPHTLACVLNMAAVIHQLRGEARDALDFAEEAGKVSAEMVFPLWGLHAAMVRASARAELGFAEEAVCELRSGVASWRAMGAEVSRPYFLGLLAEACRRGGQTETGLTAVVEALAAASETGDRWYEAELHRIKGDLLVGTVGGGSASAREGATEAEACFRRALAVARSQKARLFERRATLSLGRWRTNQLAPDGSRRIGVAARGPWRGDAADGERRAATSILAEGELKEEQRPPHAS